MLEIRFHGRGGQGTALAAKMLADAVLRSGRGFCLAFPEYGVERRGAPVRAYARISRSPILVRTAIRTPDAVAVLDPPLAAGSVVTDGLKPGGLLLLNTDEEEAAWAARRPAWRVRVIPATRLAASRGLGSAASPIVNTVMLGALAACLDLADWESLEAAIKEAVPVKPEENASAAREAFELLRALEARHAAA